MQFDSFSEPEYKGNDIYDTVIFDTDRGITDTLSLKISAGTVYLTNEQNGKKIKIYQNDICKMCGEIKIYT